MSWVVDWQQIRDFLVSLFGFLNQDLLATLLGVILGIPIALYVDRWITGRRSTRTRIDLLVLLKENLQRNLNLSSQIKKEMGQGLLPLYSLDLTIWETHSTQIICIGQVELIRLINSAYYELQHLNRKVNMYSEIPFGPLVTDGLRQRSELLRGAILTHIETLMPTLEQALKNIEESLR